MVTGRVLDILKTMWKKGEGTSSTTLSMRGEDYRKIPEGFIEDVIPGGRYAVYTYKGEMTPESVREFYNNIYYRWLAEDGLSPSRNECFEHYDSRFKEGSGKSEYDIWVPVV